MAANQGIQFDEIGYWSELKLEILKRYAQEYSKILSNQPGLTHYYIDGFAGSGFHVSKSTGEFVPGSPLNALNVRPPFKHHYLIDLDGSCVGSLRNAVGARPDVTLFEGDCNDILLKQIFPNVRYEQYRRALCLLDPYGLHLRWEVIKMAGALGTIDLFLNFPIMDMNRNALWTHPEQVRPSESARMTAFWGDETWKQAAYRKSAQESLFGDPALEKAPNEAVVKAFRSRLRKVAGFANVPDPLPMRNSTNAVVYYLFFASKNDTANKIIEHIFRRYRSDSGHELGENS